METSTQSLACKIEKQAVRQSHSFVDLAHKTQSLEKYVGDFKMHRFKYEV